MYGKCQGIGHHIVLIEFKAPYPYTIPILIEYLAKIYCRKHLNQLLY
nr:MAG TPA: hypothetical protein [Caudoviricetes sp.]